MKQATTMIEKRKPFFGYNSDVDPDLIPAQMRREAITIENGTDNFEINQTEEENNTESQQEGGQEKCKKRMRNNADQKITKRKSTTLAGKEHVLKLKRLLVQRKSNTVAVHAKRNVLIKLMS